MFDRGNPNIAFTKRGGERGIADIRGSCLDGYLGIQVDSGKDYAGVHRRRSQGKVDLFPGMQADARGPDYVLQRSLFQHSRDNEPLVASGPVGQN